MVKKVRIELDLTRLENLTVELKGVRRFLKHDIYILDDEDNLNWVFTHKKPLEDVEYALLYFHLKHGRVYALTRDTKLTYEDVYQP